jgi:PAS domain-containing protein
VHNLSDITPTRSNPSAGAGESQGDSDTKRLEEALRESQTLLRAIYSTVTCGIIVQDAGGSILYGNEAAERMLGLTLGQIRTSPAPSTRPWSPCARAHRSAM